MSKEEGVKKAKTVAKPRTAADPTAKVSATKAAAGKGKVTATKAMPSHEEIAILAERYWAERGWQEGAAEQDWLRAEQELLKIVS